MVGPPAEAFPVGAGAVEVATRRGRAVRIRHIRPEDDVLLVDLYHRLSPETRRLRFFTSSEMPDTILAEQAFRFSHIDPRNAAALAATVGAASGQEAIIGVARLARDADDPTTAELAIVIQDDYQREGLGTVLLDLLIQVALVRGFRRLRAVSLAENEGVQRLVHNTGLPVASHTIRGETTQIITLRED
jgi:acetyltransferase